MTGMIQKFGTHRRFAELLWQNQLPRLAQQTDRLCAASGSAFVDALGHARRIDSGFSASAFARFAPTYAGLHPARQSLYTHQHDASAAVWDAVLAGADRALIVLPTGTGKTRTFVDTIAEHLLEFQQYQQELARLTDPMAALEKMSPNLAGLARMFARMTRPPQTCIFVHREELLQQFRNALLPVFGESAIGMVQAETREVDRPIVVATIQSYLSRPWSLANVGLMIVDEAHHYACDSEWARPLHAAGFFTDDHAIRWNAPKLLIGGTATPDRTSGRPLRDTFGEHGLVHARDLNDFVGRINPETARPYLLMPHGIEVEWDRLDPEHALKAATPEQLAALIDDLLTGPLWHEKYDRPRRALVFVRESAQVEQIVDQLNARGIPSAGQTYQTPYAERAPIRKKFAAGEYTCLVNRDIGTEGFDDVGVEAVIILRAIKEARSLVVQIVGRAVRPDPAHPDITDAYIVDAGGNLRRHGIAVPIQTLYHATPAGRLSAPQPVPPTGGTRTTPTTPPLTLPGASINVLGNLLSGNPGKELAHMLQTLLPEAHDVYPVAYQLGLPADALFAYRTGAQSPPNWEDVQRLAAAIVAVTARTDDVAGQLATAWAWDQVAKMEANPAEQLPADLKPAARKLALHLRWSVWRWQGGSVYVLGDAIGPLRRLYASGEIPSNSATSLVRQQYDNLASQVANGGVVVAATEHDIHRQIDAALREYYDWPLVDPTDENIPATQRAIGALRTAWLMQWAGVPPTTGADGIGGRSPLRRLAEGTWSMQTGSKNSAVQLRDRLVAAIVAGRALAPDAARALVDAAIREDLGWPLVDPADETIPATQRAIGALRTAWLTQWAGLPPTQGAGAVRLTNLLRRVAAGSWILRKSGNITAASQRAALVAEIVAGGMLMPTPARALADAAIREDLDWPPVDVADETIPATQRAIGALRTAWLTQWAGLPPTQGVGAVNETSSLRCTAAGSWSLRTSGNSTAASQRAALVAEIVAGDVLAPAAARALVDAAIWEDLGWLRPRVTVSHAVLLVDLLREGWLRAFAGDPEHMRTARNSPLRPLVAGGQWPDYNSTMRRRNITVLHTIIREELTSLSADLSTAAPLLDAALREVYGDDWEA